MKPWARGWGCYCKKKVNMSPIRVVSEDSLEIIVRLQSWGEKIAHHRLKLMLQYQNHMCVLPTTKTQSARKLDLEESSDVAFKQMDSVNPFTSLRSQYLQLQFKDNDLINFGLTTEENEIYRYGSCKELCKLNETMIMIRTFYIVSIPTQFYTWTCSIFKH